MSELIWPNNKLCKRIRSSLVWSESNQSTKKTCMKANIEVSGGQLMTSRPRSGGSGAACPLIAKRRIVLVVRAGFSIRNCWEKDLSKKIWRFRNNHQYGEDWMSLTQILSVRWLKKDSTHTLCTTSCSSWVVRLNALLSNQVKPFKKRNLKLTASNVCKQTDFSFN